MDSLFIESDDENLYEDLRNAKIDGFRILKRVYNIDSIDGPSFQRFLGVVIDNITEYGINFGLSIFAAWLYDRIKKDKTKKTSINGTDVTNNPTQINIVINNYIQENKENKSTKENK